MRITKSLFAFALAAGFAGTATAAPLVYNVLNTSTLSGDIEGELKVTVFSNIGTFDGTGMVSGALSATPEGTITADWGSPGWDNSVTLNDIDISNPNPGSVTGTVGIDVGILGTLNFDLNIDVDEITLGLDAPVTTSPIPSETVPGPGGWSAIFPSVGIVLGATASGSADGIVDINIAPFSFGGGTPVDIPVLGTLDRLFSGPTEVGTQLTVPLPGVGFEVPAGDPVSQPAPGCELQTFFCAVNVTSVELEIVSLEFLNVTGNIVADNLAATIPVPEPALAAVFAATVVGGVAIARRRRS